MHLKEVIKPMQSIFNYKGMVALEVMLDYAVPLIILI